MPKHACMQIYIYSFYLKSCHYSCHSKRLPLIEKNYTYI